MHYQFRVALTGHPEPTFQSQTVATGFHIHRPWLARSSAFDKFRILEQILKGNRVVPPFPIHANHSEKSCGALGRIMKHGTSGNLYGGFQASRLVQYGGDRSFQTVSRHSSHFCPSRTPRTCGTTLNKMVARIAASVAVCLRPNVMKITAQNPHAGERRCPHRSRLPIPQF